MVEDNPDSIRERHEMDDRWESTRRHHRFFSVTLAIFAIGLVALAWFAYSAVGRHDLSLAQMPVLQKDLAALGDQTKVADSQLDSKLTDWSSRQQELLGQMDRGMRDLKKRIESVGKQANDSATELIERVQTKVASQMDSLQTRLGNVETAQDADHAQIARLQQELGQVKTQMAEQSKELAEVRGKADENAGGAAGAERQLASLKDSQQHDRRDFDTFAGKAAVRRVDFEVSKNHSRELAPGISLGVKGTNVSDQRVNGWVWVIPDRQTTYLRDQKILQPLTLSSAEDGRKRELVITHVTKNAITGYLLLPARDEAVIAQAN